MGLTFWMILWKVFFIATIGFFGVMAVWVTVQGARDIKWLLALLREQHEEAEAKGDSD